MFSNIKVTNHTECSVIDIEGVIGIPEQSQFGNPDKKVATYAGFAEALKRINAIESKKITVNIRSTGGNVQDALLIYDTLRGLDAHITTRCSGYTASAATIIAQAASKGAREISKNCLYLIHCSESSAEGNSQSLSAAKELLDKTDGRLAAIYAENGGRDTEFYVSLMSENGGRGHWMTPEETIEAGLADIAVSGDGITGFREASPTDFLLTMLGLPALPSDVYATPGNKKRIAYLRKAVMRLLKSLNARQGNHKTGNDNAAKKEIPKTPRKQPVVDNAITDPPLLELWRKSQSVATATITKTIEDPAIGEDRGDPNATAYREDALNLRDR